MPRILFRQQSRLPRSLRRDAVSGAQAPSQFVENECDGRVDDELTTRQGDGGDSDDQEAPQ
jgi:hypothetical protein